MTRVKIFEHAFTTSDGNDLLSTWNFAACPDAQGLLVKTNGCYGSVAPAEQGNSVETTTLDGGGEVPKATFAPDQYASVMNLDTKSWSPGGMVRCENVNGDDYACSPMTFTVGLEIVRHDAGAYNQIAAGGGAVPTSGQRFSIEAVGSNLEAFIDGSSEVTVSDATYATGMPGIYCYDGTVTPIGDDLECGNMFSRHPVSPTRLSPVGRVRKARENAYKRNPRLYRG
jgi:hypothetical protein